MLTWWIPFNLGGKCKCAGEEDDRGEEREDPGEGSSVLSVLGYVGDLGDIVLEQEESGELEDEGGQEGEREG